MAMREKDGNFSCVIKKHLGVISISSTGWRKELNLVEWNGNPAKLDIRDWGPDHVHKGKGVTLRREEGAQLARLLWGFLGEEDRKAAAMLDVMHIEPETGEVMECECEHSTQPEEAELAEAAETAKASIGLMDDGEENGNGDSAGDTAGTDSAVCIDNTDSEEENPF